MAAKADEPPFTVVEIDSSSDDDDENRANDIVITATKTTLQVKATKVKPPTVRPQSNEPIACRSFWKARADDVGPSARPPTFHCQLEHARVHPKFLHSNATSHKWAFGAIAELLDNAVDEIRNGGTFVKVDKIDITKDNSPALLFQDDGGGMSPDGLRKCMSLGYSSKKSNTTIGQYGNGFKTSTMRLGADVIVFSRSRNVSKATQSVGLLSYTFLRKTGQDDVIVPMIDFDISGHWAEPIIYSSQDDWSSNLQTILEWSPFESKDFLMQQVYELVPKFIKKDDPICFEDIGPHGTKIVIYNLWLNDEGIYELSFDDDDEDIRLRDEASYGGQRKLHKKEIELQSHISYQLRYSLRAYASILYLRKFKNFKIFLRGKPIEQLNIADELKYPKKVMYKPQVAPTSGEAIVEITIGFIKEAPDLAVRGFNVYYKNRLIRPFWKVTGDGIGLGKCVVGVLEANFIEPAHDKQDFERSSLFIRLEARLKQMLMEYWRNQCHLIGYQPPSFRSGDMQKGNSANTKKKLPRHGIHEKAHLGGVPAAHIPAPQLLQSMRNRHLGNSGHVALPFEQPFSGLEAGSHDEVGSIDGSVSVDQICEENIELFIKCEEHRQDEIALKRTIEELEKELEQAKRKCAQLSAHLETKKKQKVIKDQKVS